LAAPLRGDAKSVVIDIARRQSSNLAKGFRDSQQLTLQA